MNSYFEVSFPWSFKYGLLLFLCVIAAGCGDSAEQPAEIVADPVPIAKASPRLLYGWEDGKLYFYTTKLTIFSEGTFVTHYGTYEYLAQSRPGGQAFELMYSGQSTRSSSKEAPKADSFDIIWGEYHRRRGTMQVDLHGAIGQDPGNSNLPYLFGPTGRMLIDRMPPADETEWTDTRTFSAPSYWRKAVEPDAPGMPAEHKSAMDQFRMRQAHSDHSLQLDYLCLPPVDPPHDPLGIHQVYGNTSYSLEQAHSSAEEKCSYRISEESADIVTIDKRVSQSTKRDSSNELVGTAELHGTLKFDKKQGVPIESLLEGTVSFVHPTGTFAYPVRFEYQLRDRAKFEAEAAAKLAQRKAKQVSIASKYDDLRAEVQRVFEAGGTDRPLIDPEYANTPPLTLGAQTDRLNVKHWRDFVVDPDSGVSVAGMATSPDGKWLVVTTAKNGVALIDLREGKVKQNIQCESKLVKRLSTVAFNGESNTVAAADQELGAVCIFGVQEPGKIEFRGEFEIEMKRPESITLNRQGTLLALAGSSKLGSSELVSYCSVRDMKELKLVKLKIQHSPGFCALLDPKGERLMITNGKKLERLDLVSGKSVKVDTLWEAPFDWEAVPALSPDARLVYSSHGKEGGWVTSTKQPAERILLQGNTRNHEINRFSNTGRELYALGRGPIVVWNTSTGEQIGEIHFHGEKKLRAGYQLALSPNGKQLILACGAPSVVRVFTLNKVK